MAETDWEGNIAGLAGIGRFVAKVAHTIRTAAGLGEFRDRRGRLLVQGQNPGSEQTLV